MQFENIINAKLSRESDRPLMQKDAIPVSESLHGYLKSYGRSSAMAISYNQLLNYSHANALRDKNGKLTHWETAIFEPGQLEELHENLLSAYLLLHKVDSLSRTNLEIGNIDFCEFGNSIPFRVKVIYKDSRRFGHFYLKIPDASRIYGLELEHLLSPDSTHFLYDSGTLVEAHIPGTPGDVFITQLLPAMEQHYRLVAEQFVRFNERCFARLLGDMRSYNFVVNSDPAALDFLSIRPIDFDQQCYEGRKNLYLPQYYKENHALVEMVLNTLSPLQVREGQADERHLIKRRATDNQPRLHQLLDCMEIDELSENYKIIGLRRELGEHFNTMDFDHCKTMGGLVRAQLFQILGGVVLNADN